MVVIVTTALLLIALVVVGWLALKNLDRWIAELNEEDSE